jgi:hypothetical protein
VRLIVVDVCGGGGLQVPDASEAAPGSEGGHHPAATSASAHGQALNSVTCRK